jgi:hypothetical protein
LVSTDLVEVELARLVLVELLADLPEVAEPRLDLAKSSPHAAGVKSESETSERANEHARRRESERTA